MIEIEAFPGEETIDYRGLMEKVAVILLARHFGGADFGFSIVRVEPGTALKLAVVDRAGNELLRFEGDNEEEAAADLAEKIAGIISDPSPPPAPAAVH